MLSHKIRIKTNTELDNCARYAYNFTVGGVRH